MAKFKIGQVVQVKPIRDIGIIICECKEPPNYWSVALRTKVCK